MNLQALRRGAIFSLKQRINRFNKKRLVALNADKRWFDSISKISKLSVIFVTRIKDQAAISPLQLFNFLNFLHTFTTKPYNYSN